MAEECDLSPVPEAELDEDPRDMCLHGRDAHVELGGNLGIGLPFRDPDHNFVLTGGQYG